MTDRAYGCQGLFQLGTLRGRVAIGYVAYNETLERIRPGFMKLLQFTSAARECSISRIRPELRVLRGLKPSSTQPIAARLEAAENACFEKKAALSGI
jgi:hypothetical protein